MTERQLKDCIFEQPMFYRPNNEENPLEKLQSRWTSLIRRNADKLIQYASEKGETDKLPSPDLYDIANEMDAFFTAFKLKL